MDSKIVIAIGIVVLASGCTSITGGNNEDNNKDLESDPAQGKGLEVTGFSATDSSLTPGQRSVIKLSLKNYHTIEIPFNELYMYNLGELKIEKEGDCGSSIKASSNGVNPSVECSWTIEAPTEETIGEFNSKSYNPRLMLRYDSRLTSEKDPLGIEFKPGLDIGSTKKVSKSYSNGEVTMDIKADSPVPNEGSTNLEIDLNPVDSSHITSENYRVHIAPPSIIKGECADKGNLVDGDEKLNITVPAEVEKTGSINCQVSAQARKQVQRKISVSTLYKYQQSPGISIEVKSTDD